MASPWSLRSARLRAKSEGQRCEARLGEDSRPAKKHAHAHDVIQQVASHALRPGDGTITGRPHAHDGWKPANRRHPRTKKVPKRDGRGLFEIMSVDTHDSVPPVKGGKPCEILEDVGMGHCASDGRLILAHSGGHGGHLSQPTCCALRAYMTACPKAVRPHLKIMPR